MSIVHCILRAPRSKFRLISLSFITTMLIVTNDYHKQPRLKIILQSDALQPYSKHLTTDSLDNVDRMLSHFQYGRHSHLISELIS